MLHFLNYLISQIYLIIMINIFTSKSATFAIYLINIVYYIRLVLAIKLKQTYKN